MSVPAHRFGANELHSIVSTSVFSQELVSAKTAEWTAVGLDFTGAIAALLKTSANVDYEQIECLGLDEGIPERLVATFRIKRPLGYSGDLCHPGSQEYVAFWADWDDTCQWTYLSTVQVNVHDIPSVPKEGLCYTAILPVDLTKIRESCKNPKISRVRAVLSGTRCPHHRSRRPQFLREPPGRTCPDQPGRVGHSRDPEIRNIGGIPVEFINTSASGLTLSGVGAAFAHYLVCRPMSWIANAPLAAISTWTHNFIRFYYRVRVRKSSNPLIIKVLDDSFPLERWVHPPTFDTQIAIGGFFKYPNPVDYVTRTIAVWSSSALASTDKDDLWEMQLNVATAPTELSIIGSSPWYRVQLDNTAPATPPASPPTIDIHIDAGGDCKDFTQDSTITGTFVANDLYFGSWSLPLNQIRLRRHRTSPRLFIVRRLPGRSWRIHHPPPQRSGP